MKENVENELIRNLHKLHTTDLGMLRIRKNLALNREDAVEWCKEQISAPEAKIIRKGKNWYIEIYDCIITVNAFSFTIITAHKIKS